MGSYSANITIPDPVNYSTYQITASALYNGETFSAQTSVQYYAGAPVVQSFVMSYNGDSYNLSSLGSTKPIVTFDSGEPFRFDIRFSNPDQIEKVYICSTRSNVTKRMEAVWNENTKSYIAEGYFDPSNKSYVPGTISAQYSKVRDKLSFETGVDYSSEKYVNGASSPIKAVLDGKVKDCVEDLVSTDNSLSGVIKWSISTANWISIF